MAASVVQVDPILVVAAVFVAPTKPVAAVVAAVEQAMLVAVVAAAGQATAAADFAAILLRSRLLWSWILYTGSHWFYRFRKRHLFRNFWT